MRHDRKLPVLILVAACGLLAVEARYRQHEEAASEARHRHRHGHESPLSRRNHHEQLDRRPWSQDLDYEKGLAEEEESAEEDDRIDEGTYNAWSEYERAYGRSSKNGYRGRAFESRYPAHGYHRPGHRAPWYNEDNDRRRGPPRYLGRNHRFREDWPSHRGHVYNRGHDASDYDYEEAYPHEYERSRKYESEENGEKHRAWWRTARRYRPSPRHHWKGRTSDNNNHRVGRRYHDIEDAKGSRRFDDWMRLVNHNESKFVRPKYDKRHEENYEDDYADSSDNAQKREDNYEDDYVDSSENAEKEEDEEEDEEDDIWKEAENEEDEDQEDEEDADDEGEEDENDFYKSEKKPPLKTYDDIIRRLTLNDPTTPRTPVKTHHKNLEGAAGKHIKRDAFENFRYERRNFSRAVSLEHSKLKSSPYVSSSSNYYFHRKSPIESSSPVKLTSSGTLTDRKKDPVDIGRRGSDRKPIARNEDSQAKTKSLEQDYEEYLNSPDNEKEEGLAKVGVDGDSGMQADVTNTDYTEDETIDEDETPATPGTTTTTSTSTTTSTTTTSTTTTPKSSMVQHFDYRDPRAYDTGTGAQYNGYQSKNDYPPMSAHSAHKWQSLGTRESVKETRNNMQQYNKNGKAAEIREAIQHARKVSKEGSCRWPRPRVIPVRDLYPSPSTTYIPHCVILHRCSDDTGCCKSEALTCVPKHSHRVELFFYTTKVNGSNVVEKLSFYNHTECECRERTEYETPNEKPTTVQRIYRHYPPPPQPQNIRRPAIRKQCECPSEFRLRIVDGKCQCVCDENDQNCIKTRRGKGYFSLADRSCIQREACVTPSCEFGEYIKQQGRCPRKKDRFNAIANYRPNLTHHRYRS